jgi:tetratricopeptide (TPR) repeat protein
MRNSGNRSHLRFYQIGLTRTLLSIKGYTSEAEEAYMQALKLCEAQGEIPQLFPVLRGLSSFYNYRAEFDKGAAIGEIILRPADSLDDNNMRVAGYLVLAKSLLNPNEAEACYQQAMNIAWPFEARMLELRAATRLSRLWRDQGKADRAAKLLSEVYQTCDEGFAVADLIEAKALLDELQ